MEMSELREEIERQFAQKGLLDDKPKTDETKQNKSSENTEKDITEPVEVFEAPQSFEAKFAEDFKNLSPEWQRFLCVHEEQFNQAMNSCMAKLQSYGWVEKIFAANKERLHLQGIQKMEQWLEGLATIDALLQQKPVETLNAIAVCYGVKPLKNNDTPETNAITREVIGRLCNLERDYRSMQEHLQQEKYQRLGELIGMFGNQTDAGGHLLHPYFEEVKQQIFDLLLNGTAGDVADAYEKALWLHPVVREKLIEQKISTAAEDAQKAKQASFAPKGKAEAPQRELTLREEIEKNMAAFMD
jgi:hypothetical protein